MPEYVWWMVVCACQLGWALVVARLMSQIWAERLFHFTILVVVVWLTVATVSYVLTHVAILTSVSKQLLESLVWRMCLGGTLTASTFAVWVSFLVAIGLFFRPSLRRMGLRILLVAGPVLVIIFIYFHFFVEVEGAVTPLAPVR